MFKIDLEKKLVANKKKSLITTDEEIILKEADAILKENTQEDILILKKMGLDHSIVTKNEIESKYKDLKSFNESRIFTIDEIKDLCVKYGLRCLEIDKYKGHVDPKLPSLIKDFEKLYKEAKPDFADYFSYKNFYIAAPKESFKLERRPVDPLLFYPIGNDRYYLVHKWGEDVSVMRLITSWKNRSTTTWYFGSMLKYYVPLMALLYFVLDLHWAVSIFPLLGFHFLLFLFARFGRPDGSTSYLEETVSTHVWNSKFK